MLYRYAGYTGLTEMESLPNNIQFTQEEKKLCTRKKKSKSDESVEIRKRLFENVKEASQVFRLHLIRI